ncbi:MAG: CRTAC1 family protein, partial [Planctomycetaceae bacterium]
MKSSVSQPSRPLLQLTGLLLTLFLQSVSSAETVFRDVTEQAALKAGTDAACWADFDNDGWTDLCVSGGVWKNNAGKTFVRVADIPTAVAADFDNDGFTDLFSWTARRLFRNNRNMSFTPVVLPELPPSVSRGACWADFNSDGFVDLFVGGYEDWGKGITWPYQILINEQGKSFRLLKSESRLRTRGVTACDFDQDGDVDVYVSNYRLQPNLLWINTGMAEFTESAAKYGVVGTTAGFGGGHSIGACWGDFNNDGLIDLFAGNFAHVDGRGDQPKSRFLKNRGPDHGFQFEDLGPRGVHYQESYATPSAGDYDNDGNLDLFFTTVYGTASFGRKNQPVLFHNDGQFQVTDVSAAAGVSGLPPTHQSAWSDYDNDGDLDLISGGRLFQNQGSSGNWVSVRLEGDGQDINRSAVGAQIRIAVGDARYTRQVEAGTGEGNQNDLKLHFGLGPHSGTVKLQITWLNCGQQTLTVPTGQLTTVKYAAS